MTCQEAKLNFLQFCCICCNVNCICFDFFDLDNLIANQLKERKPIILYFQIFNTLLQLSVSKKNLFLERGSTTQNA